MRKPRVTKVQKKLIALMKQGQHLRVQKSEPRYFIDGADAVNERTVRTMLRDGRLRAADDGLFGDAQTLVLA